MVGKGAPYDRPFVLKMFGTEVSVNSSSNSSPRVVLLIYQLKPEGAVNNWLLARLRMCFNVLLCQRCVYL